MPEPLRVLVTGATSGLGREMMRQLAPRGCRLALTGRRAALLEEAAREARGLGADVLALAGSVTDRAAVREHYARIRERWGGLDWAILNAGTVNELCKPEVDAAEFDEVFSVNVGGVVNWIEAVLPDMRRAGRGTIAGMSSLAAVRGMPGSGPYSASKAALAAVLESLRGSLRGTGVKVVAVLPGFIDVGMTNAEDERTWFIVGAADAARRILKGIERGRPLVAFPWPLAAFARYVIGNAPPCVFDRVIRRLV